MEMCVNCIHFDLCAPYTSPTESYPEVGGCPAYRSKRRYINLDAPKPDHIPQEQWDRLKECFDDIYNDEEGEDGE